MQDYAILTNRKRAVIALIHSIAFALIAARSAAATTSVHPIWISDSAPFSSFAILTIYIVVSSVLIQLARVSRIAREKLYFAFCASSASLGLLRTIFGDHNLPSVRFLRLGMLLCALGIGVVIVRSHSRTAPVAET